MNFNVYFNVLLSKYIVHPLVKIKKDFATISFISSLRPSVRMDRIGSQWTDFHEI